jgi:hypothetical protein
MKMSLYERSECFRGYLLLIGKDRQISPKERSLLLTIGKKLDFESRFCETSISDLLENNYISNEPPLFSRKEFAAAFLMDAIGIALADNELHPKELDWLNAIAVRNGVDQAWLRSMIEESQKIRHSGFTAEVLSIDGFL